MKALISSLKSWWLSISVREQRLVIIGGSVLLLGTLYWGMWQPLQARSELAQQRIQTEKQLYSWVTDKANSITSLRKAGGAVGSNQTMNQVIDRSSRQFKIELIRVQPRSDMLQVWIQPTSFNQLVNWLMYLKQQQGMEVEFLDIDRDKQPGMVKVNRLQFKRGS